MEKGNNKETINLLDLSENESELSDLVFPPKKKKLKRRHRANGAVKVKKSTCCGCSKRHMRLISLWLGAILMTFWLVILSWLAVIMYKEVKRMDISIKSGKNS